MWTFKKNRTATAERGKGKKEKTPAAKGKKDPPDPLSTRADEPESPAEQLGDEAILAAFQGVPMSTPPLADANSPSTPNTPNPPPTFADLRAARAALEELRKCNQTTAKFNWGLLIKHTGLWREIQWKGTEPKPIMSVVLTRAEAVFRIALAQLAVRETRGYELSIGPNNRDTPDLNRTARELEATARAIAPNFSIDPDTPAPKPTAATHAAGGSDFTLSSEADGLQPIE